MDCSISSKPQQKQDVRKAGFDCMYYFTYDSLSFFFSFFSSSVESVVDPDSIANLKDGKNKGGR